MAMATPPPQSGQGGTAVRLRRPGQLGGFLPWRRGTRGWWDPGHRPPTRRCWSVGTSCSTDGGLVLHDHGGSSGAFHVVWGALDETSTTRPGHALHQQRLVRSEGKSFGSDYVHSVANSEATVATSIHAYSPPLTSMNFYETSPAGLVLSRVETDWDGAP
jgi:hypothetical protein